MRFTEILVGGIFDGAVFDEAIFDVGAFRISETDQQSPRRRSFRQARPTRQSRRG